jgi:drug/metabolite transporter (DMT)-like permease
MRARVLGWTALAMIAFAANSLLCRIALRETSIDPASFTAIRLVSGALVLLLVVRMRGGSVRAGSWLSALALFVYAAAFSFAYVSLPAATGALLLFGAVQVAMVGHGLWRGERLRGWKLAGFVFALAGLVGLLLPGISAPPPVGAGLMLSAGIAWGVYSLRGRGAGDATCATAGNFLRTVPAAAVLMLLAPHGALDRAGIAYAIASGALASGLGYVVWYSVLPALRSTSAATVQLSVPLLAGIGGIAFLGEAVTPRLLLAGAAVLGGIALVVRPEDDA